FVDGNETGGGASFALGQLGLNGQLSALGVKHREEISDSTLVALTGQRHGLGGRALGSAQIIAANLLAPEIHEGVLGLLERSQDSLLIEGQLGVGPRVGGLDAGAHVAEVQGGPGDAGAERVSLGAALEKAGDLAGLQAEAAVEGDAREEVR